MQQMSAVDYSVLVEELSFLEGAFLVKAYAISRGVYRFKFNSKTRKEVNFIVELGQRCYLTKYLEETADSDSLVTAMRNLLENARVKKIRQLNEDRLIAIDLDKADSFTLVLEMFGKGNAMLCDASLKILKPLLAAEYSARKLLKGETYALPPNEKTSPLTVKELTLENVAPKLNITGKAVSFLSKHVNLAPFYLDEAVIRAGFEKTADASDVDFSKILKQIRGLCAERSPCVYYEASVPVAFSFTKLEKFAGFECKEFASFSEALDEYYHNCVKTSRKSGSLEKMELQITRQHESLKEFEHAAEEARRAGDWVFENSDFVEKLFARVRELKAAGKTLTETELELNALLKKKNWTLKFKDYQTLVLEEKT